MSPLIHYGANFEVVGKTDPQKLSYAGAFIQTAGTLDSLVEHMYKGHPWMPALLDLDQPRWQSKANYAELVAIDVDNQTKRDGQKVYLHQMTIAEALEHPFIKAYGCLGVPSSSHKEGHDKFRLVFRYAQAIKGHQNIRIAQMYLMFCIDQNKPTENSVADASAKDASRFFFSGQGKEPFLKDETKVLPVDFLDQALAWRASIEADEKARAEKARLEWEQRKASMSVKDADDLITSALSLIDPNCSYNEWLAIGFALKSLGEQWFSAWDSWSAGATNYNPREMRSKWNSFKGESSVASIFGIAKRFGFKFPKQHKTRSEFQSSLSIQIENQLRHSDSIAFTFGETIEDSPTVIASGAWFGDYSLSYKNKLKKELKRYEGKTAIIFGNWQQVNDVSSLGNLVASLGFTVAYNIDNQNYTSEDFVKESLKYKRDIIVKAEENRLSALTYAPTLKLSLKYLTDYLPKIQLKSNVPLLFVSSPTGSGKTELLISLKKQVQELNAHAHIINISYRNPLSKQTADRVGLMHVHDVADTIMNYAAFTMCVDSILKIKIEEITQGSLIIFDEVEALLAHLLLGSTCKSKRVQVIEHLTALINRVIELGGHLVAMEADLTDISVGHFLRITNQASYDLVVNTFETIKFPITLIDNGDKQHCFAHALELLKKDERVMFVSNSQGACEQLHKLIEREFPGKFTLRIDGKTSETDEVKAVLGDLNKATTDLNIQTLIVSPSLESGGNITTTDYSEMVFFFSGVSTRKANQMLCRLRTDVRRTGAVKDNRFLVGDSQALLVRDIAQNLMDNQSDAEKLCKQLEHESYQTLAYDLASAGNGNRTLNLSRLESGDSSFDKSIYLQTAIALQARDNCSSSRLTKSFVEYYEAKGFDITIVSAEECGGVKKQTKEVAEEIKQQEIQEIVDADGSLTEAQVNAVEDNPQSKRAERTSANKSKTFLRFGGELDLDNPEIVQTVFIEDDGKLPSKVDLLALMLNPEKAEIRFLKEIQHADQKLATDLRMPLLRIRFLRDELCFHELLELKETFNNEHEVVQKIFRLAKQASQQVKRHLGLTITDKTTPMTFISRLMSYVFGFSLSSKKVGAKGQQYMIYWIDEEKDQIYKQVYFALARKLQNETFTARPLKANHKPETQPVEPEVKSFGWQMTLSV